jgi:phage baseplate assembly protein W
MLPTGYEDDLTQDFTVTTLPSRTFRLNETTQSIGGYRDGIEALKQAIYLILHTERYDWLIYSWDYGVELRDLIGMPIDYCKAEAERRISEALLQDDRITAVQDFSFEAQRKKLLVSFTVVSNLGSLAASTEVSI